MSSLLASHIYFSLLSDAPKMRPNTKFIRYAQQGVQTDISFSVDIRPTRVEFTWFWMGEDTNIADKARQRILSQNLQAEPVATTQQPANARAKRFAAKPVAVTPLVSPWVGRVKLEAVNSGADEMKISLSFREVLKADFGIYMCQLKHKAGQREFYFELKLASS